MKTSVKTPVKNAVKLSEMLIGGKFVAAANGATREIFDPASGELVGVVPESSREDIRHAVLAAREAFDRGPWRKTSALERGKLLLKIGDLIRADAKALAELEVRNMGKPLAEAEYDVADAANCFEFYGGLATKIHGETMSVPANSLSFVLREPVGVCGQIIPWNYPLLMAAWKMAPALAAGCTLVLKPSELTPLTALALAHLIQAAGVPAGGLVASAAASAVISATVGDGFGCST